MSQAIAYGSLTLIDITDVGEFSVQPMSNLPLSVIYDPDQNIFTPNWGTTNLTITPSIYYAGNALSLTAQGLTITWQRQVGVGARTTVVSGQNGETITNGVLYVSSNKFTSDSTFITYIVTATYVEPTSNQSLTAQGQITFSMIRNASTAQTCTITGENVFKYNSSQTLIGTGSITLTARVTNVSISGWQYLNSSGNWATYPNSGTGTTLTVNAADQVFTNDKCTIKCVTSDNDVYDLHTIVKIRDGAPGEGTVSAVLTNEDQVVPFNSSGVGDFTLATSQVIIYEGGSDVTSGWTISQSASGCTTQQSATTTNYDTVAVTAMSGNSASVTFTCTKTGYNTITKVFSLVKVQSGQDGVSPTVYSLEADTYALNRDISNAYTPTSVTFKAFSHTGTSTSPYSGRFYIFEGISRSEYDAASVKPQPDAWSTSDVSYFTHSPLSNTTTSILCLLFASGGASTILDSQTVVVTSDGATGATGATGAAGASAINVAFGNYSDVLTCDSNDDLVANQTITIPFTGYQGASRVDCTTPYPTPQLLGIDGNRVNAINGNDGYVTWTLPQGTHVGNGSGTVQLSFTIGSNTINEIYSWSRNSAAVNGQNAVVLQLSAPYGNTVNQNVQQVTLQALLTDGASDVSQTQTYEWAKWTIVSGTGQYSVISGQTGYQLTVNSSDIDGYASYRAKVQYPSGSGNYYYAYYSVFDKTDPIQVAVLSSLGNQIVNGQGAGAIYARVTRNNSEIDNIKSERFLPTAPTGAKTGDYYYHVDTTNKTLVLKKYNGGNTWDTVNIANEYDGTYNWTWRDKDGNSITRVGNHDLPTGGPGVKAVYIDGDLVDGKIVADVQVTI